MRAVLGLGLLLACSPAPTRAPPAIGEGVVERLVVATAPAGPAVGGCLDAACWTGAAAEAERLGALDVAASHHHRAFVAEPTGARLGVWVDAAIAGGDLRRARDGLEVELAAAKLRGDAALVAEVQRRLAELPVSAGGDIAVTSLSDGIKAAYAARNAGQLEAAAAGFAGVREPYHVVYAGDVQARRGDMVGARRLWARARAEFNNRGATLRVDVVESHFVKTAGWSGGELALMGHWNPIQEHQDAVGVLQLRRPEAGSAVRRLYAPRSSGVLALSEDGLGFLRDEDGVVMWQDLLSGALTRPVATPGKQVSALLTRGTGDGMLVLCAAWHETSLWDARGRKLESYVLEGTTPTIMRVYTGEGTHHDNILDDSPTWPVALAMTDRAGLVAIGGSDSKIRVYIRGQAKPRVLAFPWKYTERRHMGGNPDLNEPLALRFDAQDRLIAVYKHGDILVWDPRGEKMLQHHAGRCTLAEATAYVNRYKDPGDPKERPDAEATEACGRAQTGAIAPDGSLVVTGGGLSGFRVRAADGRSVHYLADSKIPDQYMSIARDGAIGLVDQSGGIAVWRPGQALAEVARKEVTGPLTPLVSNDGRVLYFDTREELVFWDLAAGRRQAIKGGPGSGVLAFDGPMKRVVVGTLDAVEVREVASGKVVFRHAMEGGFLAKAVMGGGTIAIDASDASDSSSLVIAKLDGTSTTQALPGESLLALSDDGRWLATGGRGGPLRIRGMRAAGRVVHTLDAGVRAFGFSRDGSHMVWATLPDPKVGEIKVRVLAIEGAGEVRELAVKGWPESVTFTPDGAEVLLLASGQLTRWRWAGDEVTTIQQVSLILAKSAVVTDDGRALLLPGYDHVQVRTNDRAMRRIAMLYPLLGGGWVVVSSAGAVDGSDDAVDSMITRVTRDGARLVFDGRLGWDGAHVAGAWPRVLAGEDVAPPVLVRAPVAEQPLGR